VLPRYAEGVRTGYVVRAHFFAPESAGLDRVTHTSDAAVRSLRLPSNRLKMNSLCCRENNC
jgi:hypothetical protein